MKLIKEKSIKLIKNASLYTRSLRPRDASTWPRITALWKLLKSLIFNIIKLILL